MKPFQTFFLVSVLGAILIAPAHGAIYLTQQPSGQQFYAVDSASVIEKGDLLFYDTNDVKPATSWTDRGSVALNQEGFARNFAGVSAYNSRSGDTANIGVTADYICQADVSSATTFEIGDLIAITGSGANLSDQSVVKTTDPAKAIGQVVRRETSSTSRVLVRFRSRVGPGAWEPGSGAGVSQGIIHVAPWGDDTAGDGSIENPLRTITQAHTSATAGDTVIILPGTYDEQLTVTKALNWIGYGATASIVSGSNADATQFTLNLTSAATSRFEGIGFTNTGTDTANTTHAFGLATTYNNASGVEFVGCVFTCDTEIGFDSDPNSANSVNLTFRNCALDGVNFEDDGLGGAGSHNYALFGCTEPTTSPGLTYNITATTAATVSAQRHVGRVLTQTAGAGTFISSTFSGTATFTAGAVSLVATTLGSTVAANGSGIDMRGGFIGGALTMTGGSLDATGVHFGDTVTQQTAGSTFTAAGCKFEDDITTNHASANLLISGSDLQGDITQTAGNIGSSGFLFSGTTPSADMVGTFTRNTGITEFQTTSAAANAVIVLKQDDTDEPAVEITGTSAAGTAATISSSTTLGSQAGFIRVGVNGTDYWVPFYAGS